MNRFFRGPVARLGDSEGSGLGIHIAREIAAIHNGRLEFDFDKKGIFSVTFRSPR
jgi:signal transduction histidine kinase